MVVGSQARSVRIPRNSSGFSFASCLFSLRRILYSDQLGRVGIALAFNEAVAEGKLKVDGEEENHDPVSSSSSSSLVQFCCCFVAFSSSPFLRPWEKGGTEFMAGFSLPRPTVNSAETGSQPTALSLSYFRAHRNVWGEGRGGQQNHNLALDRGWRRGGKRLKAKLCIFPQRLLLFPRCL